MAGRTPLALAAAVVLAACAGLARAQASLDNIDLGATHDRPFLVVEKAFPVKVGVERDFPVVITLYNVGENSAFEVSVEDLTWYSGANEGASIGPAAPGVVRPAAARPL